MRDKEEILKRISEFEVDIWSNPKRPDSNDIQNGCEYCGRDVGKHPIQVHINTSGTILPNDITEDELDLIGMQSQGCWSIGSNCAKKLFGSRLKDYMVKSK